MGPVREINLDMLAAEELECMQEEEEAQKKAVSNQQPVLNGNDGTSPFLPAYVHSYLTNSHTYVYHAAYTY